MKVLLDKTGLGKVFGYLKIMASTALEKIMNVFTKFVKTMGSKLGEVRPMRVLMLVMDHHG